MEIKHGYQFLSNCVALIIQIERLLIKAFFERLQSLSCDCKIKDMEGHVLKRSSVAKYFGLVIL